MAAANAAAEGDSAPEAMDIGSNGNDASGSGVDEAASDAEANSLEDYWTWKERLPWLYDTLVNHGLDWPSLGLEVSSRRGKSKKSGCNEHVMYVGSYPAPSSNEAPSLLKLAVSVPVKGVSDPSSLSRFTESKASSQVSVTKRLVHPVSEAVRFSECRAVPELVASAGSQPTVYLWGMDTQPNNEHHSPASTPHALLLGHTGSAGYSHTLCWGVSDPLLLSTGSPDGRALIWSLEDLNNYAAVLAGDPHALPLAPLSKPCPTKLAPRHQLGGHDLGPQNDAVFLMTHPLQLASIGEDGALNVFDARAAAMPTVRTPAAHPCEVTCLAVNPGDEHSILTGDIDGAVRLWDQRRLGADAQPLHRVHQHRGNVTAARFSPHHKTVFGTSGFDHKVFLYDSSKGFEATTTPGLPDALLFTHIGHCGPVEDFAFDPTDPLLVSSVASDVKGGCTLQVWRVSELLQRTWQL